MNIGIDLRPLLSPTRTGVGEYMVELLSAVFALASEHRFFLFASSLRSQMIFPSDWNRENVCVVDKRFSNKMLNMSLRLFGVPKIDQLMGKLDYFFSPNLGFVSLSSECKHILTIHDLSFEIEAQQFSAKRRLWHSLVNPRQQCLRADQIVVPSEATKRDVVRTYQVPAEKIQVIRPGLSRSFISSSASEEQVRRKYNLPRNFILTLGTIEPRKNLHTVLEAFQLFKNRTGSRLHLVVAGPRGWKYRPTLRLLRSVADVHEIGYVADEDKPTLYRLARMFVYPSLYEGFGLPVLEAMGAGTPVITSAISSLPEVGGGAVYYVNPDNAEELFVAFKRLTTHPTLLHQLRQAGLRRAAEFSWYRSAQDFLHLFV